MSLYNFSVLNLELGIVSITSSIVSIEKDIFLSMPYFHNYDSMATIFEILKKIEFCCFPPFSVQEMVNGHVCNFTNIHMKLYLHISFNK